MIDFVVKKWDKNKGKLENFLLNTKQEEYDSYKTLLSKTIQYILNDDDYGYDETKQQEEIKLDDIVEIDFGSYQGTLIYIFHYDTYQPSTYDTFYTSVDYGSCSGCDILLSISGYGDGLPTQRQVDEYMQLCLNLMQEMKFFKEFKGDNE